MKNTRFITMTMIVLLVLTSGLFAVPVAADIGEEQRFDIVFGAIKWSGPNDQAIPFGSWLSPAWVTLSGKKIGSRVLVYEYGDISRPFWVEESAVIPLGVLEHQGYRYITPGSQKWSGPDEYAILFGQWSEKWEYVTTDGAVIGRRILVYDRGDRSKPFWVNKDSILTSPTPAPESAFKSVPCTLSARFTLTLPAGIYLALVEQNIPAGNLGITCYDRSGNWFVSTFPPPYTCYNTGQTGIHVANLETAWWCEAHQFERDDEGHQTIVARSQMVFVTPRVRELARDP